jgi:carbon starvation protein CstA
MISGIPSVFMLVMTFWATIINEMKFLNQNNLLLTVINTIVILIVMAVTVEGLMRFFKAERWPQVMRQA